jgi:thiosulfate/3-mercaptopyruvate sulfurtransferase
MKRLLAALCLFLASLSAGAAQRAKPPALRTQMLVSTEWLGKRQLDPNLLVIHVGQGRKKYDAGHITGARFLEYNDVVVTRDGVVNELPPVERLQQVFSQLGVGDGVRVVLLCDMQGLMAARVYWTLDYLGFAENAALLDGGLEKWRAEKRELSVATPEVQARRFTPRLNPKVIVSREVVRDISWLNANSEVSPTVLLDARESDAYTGEFKSKNVTANGHIPGAVNVYWMETLTSKEFPTLKPVDDLRQTYTSAGAVFGKNVVTYCWIGMYASHGYFVLKYLGYDVAMYDGSFTEWVKSDGTTAIQGKNRR